MKKLIAALLLLALTGCGTHTPAPAITEAPATEAPGETAEPAETQTPASVRTDWSKLTPYEPAQPIYTLHPGYAGRGDPEAREDYGVLLPYIGRYAAMERYVIDRLPFYGLVTDKGELVTDPVYSRVAFYDDCLVLYRGDPEGVGGGDTYIHGGYARILAAPDGHWVRPLEDGYFVGSSQGLLLTAGADGSLDVRNTEGEIMTHFDGAQFSALFGEGFYWNEEGGPFLDWIDDRVGYVVSFRVNGWEEVSDRGFRVYLDFAAGTVSETPPEGCQEEIDYDAISRSEDREAPQPPEVEGCRHLTPITDRVTGVTYFSGYLWSEGTGRAELAVFDAEGKLLMKIVDLAGFEASSILRGGLCSTLENGCFCYRSLSTGELVFRYPLASNSD